MAQAGPEQFHLPDRGEGGTFRPPISFRGATTTLSRERGKEPVTCPRPDSVSATSCPRLADSPSSSPQILRKLGPKETLGTAVGFFMFSLPTSFRLPDARQRRVVEMSLFPSATSPAGESLADISVLELVAFMECC